MSKKATSPIPPAATVVDEFGTLTVQIAPWKPILARYEKVRKQILSSYSEAEAKLEYIAKGTNYDAVVSPQRPEEKIISMRALARRLKDVFYTLARVGIKDVRDQLRPTEIDKFLVTEQTGYRSVKSVRRKIEVKRKRAA